MLVTPALLAQSGSGYDLEWNTHGAGAGTMNGPNGYALRGTIAPVDGSASAMTGPANYALRGGFWAGVHETSELIFRSGFESAP